MGKAEYLHHGERVWQYIDTDGYQFIVIAVVGFERVFTREEGLDVVGKFAKSSRFGKGLESHGTWRRQTFTGPDIVLEEHLRFHELESKGSSEDFEENYRSLMRKLRTEDFDMKKPLWRLDFITPGRNAPMDAVFQFHHCLADGMSLVTCILKDIADPDEPLVKEVEDRMRTVEEKYAKSGFWQRLKSFGSFVEGYLSGLVSTGKQMVHGDPVMPDSPFQGDHIATNQWECTFSEPYDLSQIKAASKKENSYPCDLFLRTAMAASTARRVPGKDEPISNNIGFLVKQVGNDVPSTLDRLKLHQSHRTQVQNRGWATMSETGLSCVGALPRKQGESLFRSICKGTSMAVSNMLTVDSELRINGNPMKYASVLAPTTEPTGLSLSFLTYRGQLLFTTAGTALTLSEQKQLLSAIKQEIDSLCK